MIRDLGSIEARASAATAGWWVALDDLDGAWQVHSGKGDEITGSGLPEADAEFIAHAREDVPALIAEVRRLRAWQRTISDACGLTDIHAGYSPYVPDATPGVVALIQDAFTRSLHHAECERVEWEESVLRGEVDGMVHCPECKTGVGIEEQSEEQSGFEEQERNYWVQRLDCGHEIATEMRR